MPGKPQDIFERVARLSAPERFGALDLECAGDEGLRSAIESLLEAHDRATGTLGAPTYDSAGNLPSAAAAVDALRAEGPGTRIGPYKLLQLIGEGGFGSVFLAEQETPVVRRVALKVIKLGMDTRRVIARFDAERQALARMDHPHIARVFDAGATDAGRPFFVMELVQGVPITQYCDEAKLSVRARLELFEQVCHAIQHAHQKGIIHRDIKPSNVLVARLDGQPAPKVIDFGIAKATAGRLTDKTLVTELHQLIGTPEYMSPEQAEGSAADIDTRSDIYSLGVLLYELLTGALPFESTRLRSATLSEIQRIIREEEPRKPSTRLSTLETLPGVAERRNIEPPRLGRLLRGDLDWIAMKCLEKERARRYETVNSLAMDVRRYLSGEAVLAVPPSTAYRLRKFVRRNRGPVIAAALVGTALVLGVVGTTVGLKRARRAQAEAEARRSEIERIANFQARMLDQVDATDAGTKLMEDLVARVDDALDEEGVPEAARTLTTRAFRDGLRRVNATDTAAAMIDRTILAPAVQAIDKQLAVDQPVVAASLRQTLAGLYLRLGRFAESHELCEQALATRRQVLGQEHPDTLTSLNEMGVVLQRQGKASEAEPYYRETLETRRRILGNEHRQTLTSMNNLGNVLQDLGRLAEAEPYYREALETRRRVLGPDDPDTLVSVSNLGLLLEAEGKAAEAEPYYREALEKSRRVLGDDHPDTLISINNMGYLLQTMGRLAEAEPYRREALERTRRVLGEDHPATLANLSNMAVFLYKQGKFAESERLLREALDKRRRMLGEDHPEVIAGHVDLSVVLRAQDRRREAETLLRRGLEQGRRIMGADHPYMVGASRTLGSLLQEEGRLSEAEPYLREVVERTRRAKGADHVDTATAQLRLGVVLRDLPRYHDAEEQLLLAEPVLRSDGATAARHRECLEALVALYERWQAAEPGAVDDAKLAQWRSDLGAAARVP